MKKLNQKELELVESAVFETLPAGCSGDEQIAARNAAFKAFADGADVAEIVKQTAKAQHDKLVAAAKAEMEKAESIMAKYADTAKGKAPAEEKPKK